MVSNERQRQYAIVARKKHSRGKKGTVYGQEAAQHDDEVDGGCEIRSSSPFPEIDPKLNQYHYDLDASFSDGHSKNQEVTVTSERVEVDADMKYLVNILQSGRRIKPKAVLTPSSCPGFPSLMAYIHGLVHGLVDGARTPSSVKVLGPNGLLTVGNDDAWNEVVASVQGCEWMDRELKCIIELDG